MSDERETPEAQETPADDNTAAALAREFQANGGAEPAEPAEGEESNTAADADKPGGVEKEHQDPDVARIIRKRLARQERQLERKMAEREAKLREAHAQVEERARALARYEALDRAQSMQERARLAGIDFEKLAEEVLGKGEADQAREAARAEVARIEAERAEAYKRERGKEAEQATRVREQAEETFLRAAAKHDSIIEMARAGEWDDGEVLRMAYREGARLQKELGRVPQDEEILAKISEKAARFLGKAVSDANGQRATPANTAQGTGKPGNRAATLTPKQAEHRASGEDDFDPNDRQSVARFLAREARKGQRASE